MRLSRFRFCPRCGELAFGIGGIIWGSHECASRREKFTAASTCRYHQYSIGGFIPDSYGFMVGNNLSVSVHPEGTIIHDYTPMWVRPAPIILNTRLPPTITEDELDKILLLI